MTQRSINIRAAKALISLAASCASVLCLATPPKTTYIDEVIRLANHKIAHGESPDVVENWMTRLLDERRSVSAVDPAPWDVFASAQRFEIHPPSEVRRTKIASAFADTTDRNTPTLLITIPPDQSSSREDNDVGSAHSRDDFLLPAERSAGERVDRAGSGVSQVDRTSRGSADGADVYSRWMDAPDPSDMGTPTSDFGVVAEGDPPLQGR
jgi:hypothetical protein